MQVTRYIILVYAFSQVMSSALSSLDLGHEATATGRQGQETRAGGNMASLASVAPAMPGRVTPAQDLLIESQGAASAPVEMSAPTVQCYLLMKACFCLLDGVLVTLELGRI
jgi:hypothetical protein